MSEQIRCIDDLTRLLDPAASVVTMFSGGLDGMYLLHLLAERGFRRVTALVVDLADDTDRYPPGPAAAELGVDVMVLDRRAEFIEECVLPAIRAHAVYLGVHPVSASLSRPLIARTACGVATGIGASAILHSASQSQNSLRRLNGALALLGYAGHFGSPYERSAVPREEKRRVLKAAGIPLASSGEVSLDTNLWCREFESGPLDDPRDVAVPDGLYRWSVPAGDEPAEITVEFDRGRPVALDGRVVPAAELIADLNRRAGSYGIGRYTGLEHLGSGDKVLEVREAPAAAVLLMAYRHLESATVDAETIREKLHVEQVWIREAVEGRWFGPLRTAAEAFIATVAQAVTGTVRLRLSPRGAELAGIRAPHGLYVTDREVWEARSVGEPLGALAQERRRGG